MPFRTEVMQRKRDMTIREKYKLAHKKFWEIANKKYGLSKPDDFNPEADYETEFKPEYSTLVIGCFESNIECEDCVFNNKQCKYNMQKDTFDMIFEESQKYFDKLKKEEVKKMRFLKQYKCPECGEVQWEVEEPDFCLNEKCKSKCISYCADCKHFNNIKHTCKKIDEPYNVIVLNEALGDYVTYDCDDFSHK
jgi:hypothetical protein